MLTIKDLEKIIESGESLTVEFKSWIKEKSTKDRINLAVDELIAFANAKGGTIYFGIEDDGEITGCSNYDCQKLIEAIYDKTRPSPFADIDEIDYKGYKILALSVQHDGITYATTDGRCLKRLGKNSKPFYPDEMSHRYTEEQSNDFTGQVITESTIDDVNMLEVYNLKEKLKIRDANSTLPELDDKAFLKDLGLVRIDEGKERLTIAGLLFVGKESSINRFLPQAEVIYLHYGEKNLEEYNARLDMKMPIIAMLDRLTQKIQNDNKIVTVQIGLFRLEISDFSEKVFQEAFLNAVTHRDYQSNGAVYVKHYPDKIMIENPGGFLEDINETNIITHPSVARNRAVAETLQRLKYVQRTGQGVDIIFKEMISMGKPYPEYRAYNDAVTLTIYSTIDDVEFVKFVVREQDTQQRIMSLSELMILRRLTENKKIILSEVAEITQTPVDMARKNCNNLIKMGLVELSGKEYMLSAKAYEALKTDIEYTRDKSVQYIRAKNMILEYLDSHEFIANVTIQELCGFTKQQARSVIDKMRNEGILDMAGNGRNSKYFKL